LVHHSRQEQKETKEDQEEELEHMIYELESGAKITVQITVYLSPIQIEMWKSKVSGEVHWSPINLFGLGFM
jgi:hypothetical protein